METNHFLVLEGLAAANKRLREKHKIIQSEIKELKRSVEFFSFGKEGNAFICKHNGKKAIAIGKSVSFFNQNSTGAGEELHFFGSKDKSILAALRYCHGLNWDSV